MKKVLVWVLALAMMLGAVSTVAMAETTEGAYKTGMGIVTKLSSSKAATAEADGNAQVDSVMAAVVLDAEGKIVSCAIDTAQTKMAFSAEGKVVSDLATEFKSKQEQGDDYGMRGASAIGKEWNEQANALAEYVIGKTADEVAGIALTDTTAPADEDLTASVTIKIGGYIAAITKACANAKELGAQEGDKLGLAVVTNMSKSKDVADDADGKCQAYSFYGAVTVNADGVITSCAMDASQGTVTFDATGAITCDLEAEIASKQELGDDYGMRAASGIGKEWNEQADAFAAYVTGKTADEVAGIALTEGKATDEDLTASVTVSIDSMMNVVTKAVANAK